MRQAGGRTRSSCHRRRADRSKPLRAGRVYRTDRFVRTAWTAACLDRAVRPDGPIAAPRPATSAPLRPHRPAGRRLQGGRPGRAGRGPDPRSRATLTLIGRGPGECQVRAAGQGAERGRALKLGDRVHVHRAGSCRPEPGRADLLVGSSGRWCSPAWPRRTGSWCRRRWPAGRAGRWPLDYGGPAVAARRRQCGILDARRPNEPTVVVRDVAAAMDKPVGRPRAGRAASASGRARPGRSREGFRWSGPDPSSGPRCTGG